MVYFSILLAVEHVNLILWLKAYVALIDLYNLKILLCDCKVSFKIGSLRCVKYIEKKPAHYQSLIPFLGGDNIKFQTDQ